MGWASLANDASSELLYPVLPLFLVGTLGAPAAAVGAVEGAAEATSQIVGLVVSRRSDKIRRRLPFVWAGYILSGISKPLIAIAPAWGWVLGARVIDRAGKGVRTAPRDALLRDSSDPSRSGAVFGFHRFMDSAGATFGPVLGLMGFSFVTWSMLLFATAWAATASDDPRDKHIEPPAPAIISPRVQLDEGASARQTMAAMALGAVGGLALSRFTRRRR